MQFIFQKKSFILSVVFFIFSCFVFLFLYRVIDNNKEDSRLTQEKWQTEDIQRKNAKSLFDSIKTVETERALFETHFVQSSDIVPFLDTIERMVEKVGIKAEVVSVDIAKDKLSLMIEIKAVGSFEIIYKLIMLLENSPYDLEFVSVNMQHLDAGDLSISEKSQWGAIFQVKLLSFIN
ncbi:hypothetical protein CO033_01770 [Candidatus Nomurabacteria bacterium CG_4_9_14_0_2_um_filter_32_10]|uniref:Type 4a pilus biogenesis protein PilO n=3 Tax=Candidatus Nomuraibacteriota TaxID=1752729 RepID=A0A2H0CGD3_9BACT|nr:MAG: hypothetical protein COW91_02650 [Candidatus Nomurabacteria bacterium CG22_combo_CG10-13_8_21_14_all_32_8]PIZ86169.1 MAG: hypothetical protein COX94_00940 [Candidatus Nomurabacteria bacterium CG_4_10_14_0_2_um_filter_33_9]PJC49396.1 MAG: hypothetical protein CO033_01770 [Candidatus Nomurabacteria bacterium CG_4_9_14_0_2_um_filter_32_10]